MGQVVTLDEAQADCAVRQAAGQQVVVTNGHFDLLHYGHVCYLQQARALGDLLLVGLNSDCSTRQLKGPGRPLVPQEERAAVLAALVCVDLVVVFDAPTAETLVAALRPQVYVKGADWEGSVGRGEPPEAAVVRASGGVVRYLPYLPGRSTSALIARIRQLPDLGER
ncbi:MAG: adenylyltransferase/cytidyltransferase family protein [Chloroflexi bacterium]|nr:adenylyltransferase/cytidyltransferase family protein [Chloroflexota bacterium]